MQSKKCSNCGADNDLLLVNCQFCHTGLPHVDIESISNEVLLLNAGEWIGKLKEGRYEEYSGEVNIWTGKGIKVIEKSQIQGFALKYLTLLHIRSSTNLHLAQAVEVLQRQYDRGVEAFPTYIKIAIGYALFAVVMFGMLALLL